MNNGICPSCKKEINIEQSKKLFEEKQEQKKLYNKEKNERQERIMNDRKRKFQEERYQLSYLEYEFSFNDCDHTCKGGYYEWKKYPFIQTSTYNELLQKYEKLARNGNLKSSLIYEEYDIKSGYYIEINSFKKEEINKLNFKLDKDINNKHLIAESSGRKHEIVICRGPNYSSLISNFKKSLETRRDYRGYKYKIYNFEKDKYEENNEHDEEIKNIADKYITFYS